MNFLAAKAPGVPRRLVAALAGATAAVVWTQALAALLGRWQPAAEIPAALLTLGALSSVLLAAVGGGSPWRWGGNALAWSGAWMAAILLAAPTALVPALAVPIMAPLCAAGAGLLAWRLPASLDVVHILRQGRALLWLAVAVLALVQVARLATWAADPRHELVLATEHPFWAGHECLPAYLYAAELTERGETNPWDSAHYPGLHPGAHAETRLVGMTPEDPYLYPPQFLLPARLAIAVFDHYPTLRVLVLAVNFSLLFGAALALCAFVGGRRGLRAALGLPLLAVAFPTLYDLQYGQAHLAAVAMAVLAMILFDGVGHGAGTGTGFGAGGGEYDDVIGRPAAPSLAPRRGSTARPWLGGLFLASAILTKLFPAILLVPLAARRRWCELGTTLAWGVVATVAAAAVFGPATLRSFVVDHLPRLQNGSASDFAGTWPELADLVIAANQGVAGLVAKLDALGWISSSAVGAGAAGPLASRLFLVGLAIAAAVGARGLARSSRRARAVGWLALLGLGSLASPAAFADYVPATAVWMVVMLGAAWPRSRAARLAMGVALGFQLTLLGSTAIGSWADPELLIPLSLVGQVALFALLLGGMAHGFGWATSGLGVATGKHVTESSAGGHGSVPPCPPRSRPVSVP